MAVLPLRYVPDPVLRAKAKKVRTIDAGIERLIDDMIDTMHEVSGVGLAANQVGALQRVAVIHLPEEEAPLVLINPQVVRKEGEREVEEGCLSVPGYKGFLKRSQWVRVKAMDRQGKSFRIKAEELLAQALEHEIDHLDGVLYIDHLESSDKLVPVTADDEVGEVAAAAN